MNYSKLRGRIYEKFGSIAAFADAMESGKPSISRKLRGIIPWTQKDILRAVRLLDIPNENIADYFFCPESCSSN